jgi:co-chaperonin GroES (HSP10)
LRWWEFEKSVETIEGGKKIIKAGKKIMSEKYYGVTIDVNRKKYNVVTKIWLLQGVRN